MSTVPARSNCPVSVDFDLRYGAVVAFETAVYGNTKARIMGTEYLSFFGHRLLSSIKNIVPISRFIE